MSGTVQLVEPAYSHIPDGAYTDGDQVAGLVTDAGYGPDGEQRVCLDAIFAKDVYGKSVAFETWLIACRQNLKTGIEKMAAIGWLWLFAEDPVIWTAHEWDIVSEAFTDLDNLISGYAWMSRRVRYIHRGERDQEIGLKNGGRLLFKTRTPGGGRGLAGAKTILDEGWKVRASHMGSLVPTMSARSISGDPQILGGSSAAHADSEVLHGVIARGRAAATSRAAALLEPGLCYIEFCAPPPEVACEAGRKCDHALDTPGCGCDNPELIRAANPAVGRRISLDFIMTKERRSMPPAEYGRERMGWHDEPEGKLMPIPLTEWAGGLDVASEPAGPVALSVVYSSDKRRAAIGLAARRSDRTWHVEVADIVPVSGVVERVGQIVAKAAGSEREVCAVAVDPHGYEGECIKGLLDLRAVKLPGDGPEDEPVLVRIMPAQPGDLVWAQGRPPVLVRMTGTDAVTAYSGFFGSVTTSHDLFHRGQDDLTLALAGATARDVGDAGEAWGRKKSGVDISVLVAVTNARWVHELKAPAFEVQPGAWAL